MNNTAEKMTKEEIRLQTKRFCVEMASRLPNMTGSDLIEAAKDVENFLNTEE